MSYIPSVGDQVLFGRGNGEKTKGTVTKVNRTKAKVRQDESRGLQKNHKIGTIWTVPFDLLRLAGHPVTNERHALTMQKHRGKDLIQVIMDLEDEILKLKKFPLAGVEI